MKYELVYTRRAVKDIGKLDPKMKSRIGDTLLRFKEDPIAYAETLTDSKLGTYRLRVGITGLYSTLKAMKLSYYE